MQGVIRKKHFQLMKAKLLLMEVIYQLQIKDKNCLNGIKETKRIHFGCQNKRMFKKYS